MAITVADLVAKLGLKVDKKSFTAGDRLLRGVKAAIGGIIAFKTAKFFAGLVTDTINAGDRLRELGMSAGIAVEPLQQIAYAAELSGVGIEELSGSITKLNKTAYQARKGGSEQAKTFRKLKVSLKDSSGEFKSADALLGDLADRFSKMPDGPAKAALAQEVFGRSGAKMIPLLNEGRDGLAKLREEFVATGAQLTKGNTEDFDKFNDGVLKLKTQLLGLRNQAVITLLPKLQEMSDKVSKWIANNRQLIAQRLEQFVNLLIKGIEKLGETIDYLLENQDEVEFWGKVVLGAFMAIQIGAIASAAATLAAWAPVIAALGSAVAALHILRTINDEETEGSVESDVNDYETRAERKGNWFTKMVHAPSDFLADKLVQRDQDSRFGRSSNNFFRDGANRGYNARMEAQKFREQIPAQFRSNVSTEINVNVPPGMDPKEVGNHVREAFRDNWDREMRGAWALEGGE